MGIAVRLTCTPCGVSSVQPFGPALPQDHRFFFPFFCQECRGMSIINTAAPGGNCTHCTSERLVPYGHPEAECAQGTRELVRCTPPWTGGRDERHLVIMEDGRYICPSCGAGTLRFSDSGIRWD